MFSLLLLELRDCQAHRFIGFLFIQSKEFDTVLRTMYGSSGPQGYEGWLHKIMRTY